MQYMNSTYMAFAQWFIINRIGDMTHAEVDACKKFKKPNKICFVKKK